MLRPLLIAGAVLFAGDARAQPNSPQSVKEDLNRYVGNGFRYSLSQQFIIHSQPSTGWLPALGDATNLVRLEPNLLAVSCERIKHAVLTDLHAATNDWHGKIYIELHPARDAGETIQASATYYVDGWSYQLDVPDALEERQLITAVVQTLLLEMANRRSTGQSAEVPAWLSEGLTQEIMLSTLVPLVLQPPDRTHSPDGLSTFTPRNWAQTNSLTRAHLELMSRPPLSVEQLSWPDDDQFAGAAAETYRCSAQLLVCDLMALDGGRECLREFVKGLSRHLNWQLSFLEAFHDDFATQLEFEKWWALQVQGFTERNLAQTWADDKGWQKLAEIVRPSVEVRTTENETPFHEEVPLQTMLREWDYRRQSVFLRGKIGQLFLLRLHVSQDIAPLADGYRQVLEAYLRERDRGAFARLTHGEFLAHSAALVKAAAAQLDALDARLEQLRPKPDSPDSSKKDTASVLPSN